MYGEKGSAYHDAAKEYVDKFHVLLLDEYKYISYSDILRVVLNFDEFGWVLKSLPERSYVQSNEKVLAKKPLRARVTVLVGVSAAGHKFKPLVVGKSKRPLCFQNVDMTQLPVVYYSQPSAWMTAEIFESYVVDHLIPEIHTTYPGVKVIPTLDNATCHPEGM